jgi:hypothetical protein
MPLAIEARNVAGKPRNSAHCKCDTRAAFANAAAMTQRVTYSAIAGTAPPWSG